MTTIASPSEASTTRPSFSRSDFSVSSSINFKLISHDMEKSASYKRTRASVNPFYGQLEAECPAMKRAKEIQANLAPEFPSFSKTMLPALVSRGFLMRLPKEFCDLHLPRHDATVHLVNESGEEYMVKFLMGRNTKYALSGGWRKFSIANKLFEVDVLVFQLVKPSNFKVFVVRANCPAEVDGAPGLLKSASYNQRRALADQFSSLSRSHPMLWSQQLLSEIAST